MRPYEVMIIFDASLEEETIRAAVDRFTELIRSRGGTPVAPTVGAGAASPTR